MDINTLEELETNIEFVDWSLVSNHLITEDIINKFSCIPELRMRLYFDELWQKTVIKTDDKEYPKEVFFFIENKFFMNLILKDGTLFCSYKYIWSVFENKLNYEYNQIQSFVKNIVEIYFKDMEVIPHKEYEYTRIIEGHFKYIDVNPIKQTSLNFNANLFLKILSK